MVGILKNCFYKDSRSKRHLETKVTYFKSDVEKHVEYHPCQVSIMTSLKMIILVMCCP